MGPDFVDIDKYARIDVKIYDKLDAFFNAPDIPCSSILITDCTNNNLLLATKVIKLCSGKNLRTGFEEVKVGADLHDAERKHGLYSNDNIFFVDLIRIRYDDYKYFIVVLESIISQRRIDADIAGKLIIIVNNYNHVLNKYMTMFQIFIEKYAGNAVFIFIG